MRIEKRISILLLSSTFLVACGGGSDSTSETSSSSTTITFETVSKSVIDDTRNRWGINALDCSYVDSANLWGCRSGSNIYQTYANWDDNSYQVTSYLVDSVSNKLTSKMTSIDSQYSLDKTDLDSFRAMRLDVRGKPTSYAGSGYFFVDSILNSSDIYDETYINRLNWKNNRASFCEDNQDTTFTCVWTEQEGAYHQCIYSYFDATAVCTVNNQIQSYQLERMATQRKLMGIDSFDDVDRSTYKLTILDTGFEMTHKIMGDSVQSIGILGLNIFKPLTLNDDQDQSLIRVEDSKYWGQVAGGHGAAVSGIAAAAGAKLNLINRRNTSNLGAYFSGALNTELTANDIVNLSYFAVGTDAFFAKKYSSHDFFLVLAAGNNSANYTTLSNDLVADGVDVIWSSSDQNKIFVGGVQSNNSLYDKTATPGSNEHIQKRWITALATEVLTASSVVFGTATLFNQEGTSLAAPLVATVLNGGKNYCSSSTYDALSNTLLNTAKKDFSGYDSEKYGRGILDAKAFKIELERACP